MKLIRLIILSLQLPANEALAYVDPNTGGYVFQLLYPIFVAIGIGYFFLKNQIKKLSHNFSSFLRKTLVNNTLHPPFPGKNLLGMRNT